VIVQGTSVGLDVHALSVVVHAIDEQTGKIARARLCPTHGEVLGWLHQVRVTYEAGPTGFGLARRSSLPGCSAWWRRRGSCNARPGIAWRAVLSAPANSHIDFAASPRSPVGVKVGVRARPCRHRRPEQ
jgi:hypothetical protein